MAALRLFGGFDSLLKYAHLLRCATLAHEKVRLIPHDVLQAGVRDRACLAASHF